MFVVSNVSARICRESGSCVVSICLIKFIRISSVGKALDCNAGGRRFDWWGRTDTQGLQITEK